MRLLEYWVALSLLTLGTAVSAQEAAPALRLHGFLESLEIAPVLLAADSHFPRGLTLKRGGIQNLYGVVSPAYGDAGTADVATNAETQLLRYSVAHPELRAIMTVTEGRYRILARRSAGIHTLADLKGKRVGTLPNTSAAYFLELMLKSVRLEPYPPAYPLSVVAAAWPHHHYVAGKVPDLLDVMVAQELWLAKIDGRQARNRETLATLIDYSLLNEIMTEGVQ